MNTRYGVVAALLLGTSLLGTPIRGVAQPSTDRLADQGRPLTVDVSLGTESLDFGTIVHVERERGAGRLFAVSVGARWRMATIAGISATGWVLRRPSGVRYYYPTGTPAASDGHEQIVALGPTLDVQARLAGEVYGALLVGIAVVPSASNSAINASQSGSMYMLGAQLRYRRLTLTQHLLFLESAELAIQTRREFYPLSLGWRF